MADPDREPVPRPSAFTAALVEPRPGRGPLLAGLASFGLHAAGLALMLHFTPAPVPEEHADVGFVQFDVAVAPDPAPPSPPPPGPSPAGPARPRARRAKPAAAAPVHEVLAVEHSTAPDAWVAPAPAPQAVPGSFEDWQRARRSSYGLAEGGGGGGGGGDGAGGGDLLSKPGRSRCLPAPGRHFALLYLLFDSSGSLTATRRAEALSCAHSYAKAALDDGSAVLVLNFARETRISGPTRSLSDVEAAIRDVPDGSATVLPTRELGPLLDAHPDTVSELVIISDGLFADDGGTLAWYRYYLELNPENRAHLYRVGNPAYRGSSQALQQIGVDVYSYEPLGLHGG